MSSTITCGLCRHDFEHGAYVCRGCQGTVVYGPTQHEVNTAFKQGIVLLGLAGLFVVYILPVLLKDYWSDNILLHFFGRERFVPGWGFGMSGLIPVVILSLYGAWWSWKKLIARTSGLIRTFRRHH